MRGREKNIARSPARGILQVSDLGILLEARFCPLRAL